MMSDVYDLELRTAYYGQFATSELLVLLEDEASDVFSPQLVEIDGFNYALTFDTEERLADFCDFPSPYLALSGRALVEALKGQSVGVGLNLGVSDAAFLLPIEALDWVRERTVSEVRVELETINEVSTPHAVPVHVLRAIDARLAMFSGRKRRGILVEAELAKDKTNLIIFEGIEENERSSIAGALAETMRFLAPSLPFDTVFVESDDSIIDVARSVGLTFEMSLSDAKQSASSAPGKDPDKPPKLH